MRRILTLSLISLLGALASACGSSPPATDTTAKADTCKQLAAPPKEGETPDCGEGCQWSGTECRPFRGIGVPQKPDATPGNGPHGGGPPVK